MRFAAALVLFIVGAATALAPTLLQATGRRPDPIIAATAFALPQGAAAYYGVSRPGSAFTVAVDRLPAAASFELHIDLAGPGSVVSLALPEGLQPQAVTGVAVAAGPGLWRADPGPGARSLRLALVRTSPGDPELFVVRGQVNPA